MSETVIETNLPARRRLSERPDRMVHREEEGPSVTIDSSAGPTPTEALEDSRRQLQDRDRQLAAERTARAEAERARQAAEQQAAAQAHARSNDRLASATSALEAATAEQQAAELAWEAAEEAGDIKAKIAAQKALSSATFRVASATAEVEHLKSQPQPQADQRPQQNPNQPSAAAQRWIAEHPRFTAGQQPNASQEDRDYYADAMAAHHAALAMGMPAGSEGYIAEIDRRMARRYPEDGGAPPARQEQRHMRDDTAPPSRGTSGPGAGWKTARINVGENGNTAVVYYRDEGNGRRVRPANKADLANFEDGAKTCFPKLYEQNPQKALGEWLNDHIEHILEGSPDLKIGDGRIYGRSDEE